MKKFSILLTIAAICYQSLLSQPGSLDQSFGNGGKVQFNFANTNSSGEVGKKIIALQDGKALVLYQLGVSMELVRLSGDGTIDMTFGLDGYGEKSGLVISTCMLQSDGKIILIGSKFITRPDGGGAANLTLTRLTSSGLIDNSFGQNGIVVINNFISASSLENKVLIQPDGKILIAFDSRLIRLNSNGSFDNTFGANGIVTIDLSAYSIYISSCRAIYLTNQNKVQILGSYYDFNTGSYKTILIRLLPTGMMDNTYNATGFVLVNYNLINNIEPFIMNSVLQQDDKLLVAGSFNNYFNYPYNTDGFIARFQEDGSLDLTFNNSGTMILNLGTAYDEIPCISVQNDNKILISANYSSIYRLNSDGSNDVSFGINGKVIPQLNGAGVSIFYITTNSGKIFATGSNGSKYSTNLDDCIVLKTNDDGTNDNTFSEDGFALLFIRGSASEARDVFKLSNGDILCVGQNNLSFLSFAKFHQNGIPDNSYGTNGKVITSFNGYGYNKEKTLLQQDEKIIVPLSYNGKMSIVRFNTDGSQDFTYNNETGIKILPSIPNNYIQNIYSTALQSNGQLLVLAQTVPTSGPVNFYQNYSLALFRFNVDGTTDNLFGTNGVQLLPAGYSTLAFGRQVARGFVDAKVVVRNDGKIIIAGSLMNESPNYYNGTYLYLARLNSDGGFDNSFDGDGTIITSLFVWNGALSAILLNGNKILVNVFEKISRINEDGSLDNTFGNYGTINTYPNVTYSYGNIVIQQDGKIIKKGQDTRNGSSSSTMLSRFNTDGSPDITFGNNGIIIIPSDVNFGPSFNGDVNIYNDFLLLGGYFKDPVQQAIIHKYWLSDVQMYCRQDVSATTTPNNCSVAVSNIDPILSPANSSAIVNYTLSGATTGNGTGSVSGMQFNTGVTTVTYSLADDPSQTCSFTVTVNYPVTPAMSIATSDVSNNFCNGILLTANSNVPVQSYSWSNGVTTQTNFLTTANASGTYTVNAVSASGCPVIPSTDFIYDNQALTSSYTLLATNSIKLQQNNTVVNGSAGVVNPAGNVSLKKNVSINGAGAFLKAQNISLQAPYTIPTIIYAPASVALPTMQYNTTSTSGLANAAVPNGTTITLSGNFKNVTIGTNCNVTLTGNIFGAITIGSGSSALFTQSSIDVTAITMNAGTVSSNTQLRFSGDAIVRCAGSMLVNTKSVFNPDNHKVIIYLGKTSGAPVAFTVAAGGNETIYASMYIPSGKISVGGDASNMTYMNGKFIAENIETLDKNVIWNWYDCTPAAVAPLITSKTNNVNKEQPGKPIIGLNIKAWPNPSDQQFTLNVESNSNELVSISVYDMYGRKVYATTGTTNRQYQFGNRFVSGAYVAEVRQGVNRSSVKLIKQ